MRLDKYLAETAQCTRSEAKTLLQKGKVTVNGTLCKKGDTQLREIRRAVRPPSGKAQMVSAMPRPLLPGEVASRQR